MSVPAAFAKLQADVKNLCELVVQHKQHGAGVAEGFEKW